MRLQWLFAAALLACAMFALGYAAKAAHMQMQFDYEEGNILIASRAVLAGVLIAEVLYRLPFAERIICGPAYAYLQDHGDHVLTDSIGALLLTGKPVLVSNPFLYSQMVIRAGWPDRVLRKIQEKEFDVILLREQLGVYHPDDRFTGETLRAIRKNYHDGAAFECYDSGFAHLPNP